MFIHRHVITFLFQHLTEENQLKSYIFFRSVGRQPEKNKKKAPRLTLNLRSYSKLFELPTSERRLQHLGILYCCHTTTLSSPSFAANTVIVATFIRGPELVCVCVFRFWSHSFILCVFHSRERISVICTGNYKTSISNGSETETQSSSK